MDTQKAAQAILETIHEMQSLSHAVTTQELALKDQQIRINEVGENLSLLKTQAGSLQNKSDKLEEKLQSALRILDN